MGLGRGAEKRSAPKIRSAELEARPESQLSLLQRAGGFARHAGGTELHSARNRTEIVSARTGRGPPAPALAPGLHTKRLLLPLAKALLVWKVCVASRQGGAGARACVREIYASLGEGQRRTRSGSARRYWIRRKAYFHSNTKVSGPSRPLSQWAGRAPLSAPRCCASRRRLCAAAPREWHT